MSRNITYNMVFFLFFLLVSPALANENPCKTAVASTGSEATGQISTVAARAPYFLFFDQENQLVAVEKNPYSNAAGGAGSKTADFLAQNKTTRIIAGQFGHKMLNKLKILNIKAVEKQGAILDALKE